MKGFKRLEGRLRPLFRPLDSDDHTIASEFNTYALVWLGNFFGLDNWKAYYKMFIENSNFRDQMRGDEQIGTFKLYENEVDRFLMILDMVFGDKR